VAPPHRFRVGVVYAGAGIEADAENLGDGVEEGPARAPHVTREDASGTSDPPRQERKLLRRGVHARRIDEPRRKPESSLLERGLESLGHEAPCLTARLAGSERMDAETKRAVRNQRSHVHRKTDALQVRKVVADSLPAPGEGSRRHPAVDLGKDLGGAAEERRRAEAAVSYDLGGDALGDPALEERQPFVRGPRENEVAVGMEVDETRCDDLSRRVDDVLDLDLLSEARDLPAPDREISPELGCAGAVEDAPVPEDDVGSHAAILWLLGDLFDAHPRELDPAERGIAVGGNGLDRLHHLHPVDDPAESGVLVVQRGRGPGHDREPARLRELHVVHLVIEAGLREPVVYVGDLTPRRDYSDVRDIVRGYWLLLERGEPGEVYNLCSGCSWSIQQVLDFLLNLSTVKGIAIKTDPARLRPSDVMILEGDPTKMRKATGWKVEIPFERTLTELLDYWRQRTRASR